MALAGMCWTVSSLCMLQQKARVDVPFVLEVVRSCRRGGGLAPTPAAQEPEIRCTAAAVQMLAFLEEPLEAVGLCESELTLWAGSLAVPTEHGLAFLNSRADVDPDLRNYHCALILGVDTDASVWVRACLSKSEGGFGCRPGAEAHAGYTFCALSCLSLREDLQPNSLTAEWLRARRVATGGFNGRAGKPADSCYSFWVLAAMTLLGIADYGVRSHAEAFILKSQVESGGLCRSPHARPVSGLFSSVESLGNQNPDPFHTHFGLLGLAICQPGINLHVAHGTPANSDPLGLKPVTKRMSI
ncbi:MAG: uncharacterized protein KVP18_005156 [Porospora cf. gigantea A]|uniref:uncharacterized protein n=1 Tax=Porospora cf. gigantea A TaxID=2853593 RepID=UPI00355A6BC1|nr:MAG: hypothetical protein KVP18_005156 [Porospora cf. gigantea A]